MTGEILPPSDASDVGTALTPEISEALGQLRARLQDVLAIPSDKWPPDRQVELEVKLALVPTSVKVIVKKKPE